MAENKTQKTRASVAELLDAIENEARRKYALKKLADVDVGVLRQLVAQCIE